LPKLIVVTRDGEERVLESAPGPSVMKVIRDKGVDELLALCGGSCSCATCHVHVDPAYFARLPHMKDDENDLLDSIEHRSETSRLSCQIRLLDELDGMRVTIAEES
jgi:2Fe-2S ferredoxin